MRLILCSCHVLYVSYIVDKHMFYKDFENDQRLLIITCDSSGYICYISLTSLFLLVTAPSHNFNKGYQHFHVHNSVIIPLPKARRIALLNHSLRSKF